MQTFLKIKEIEFTNNLDINGVIYNLAPSAVLPSIEYIKSAERSLSGNLHVDITAVKQKLQIVFDIFEDRDFQFVIEFLKLREIGSTDTDGIPVEYFDTQNQAKYFFCDNVKYEPFIMNDKIRWKNVIIDLLEI